MEREVFRLSIETRDTSGGFAMLSVDTTGALSSSVPYVMIVANGTHLKLTVPETIAFATGLLQAAATVEEGSRG